jgi:hypothetical protein
MPRPSPRRSIALSGALLAAVVGASLGAACRLGPSRAEAATLGPRMEMSETAVLTPHPLPAHWPGPRAAG